MREVADDILVRHLTKQDIVSNLEVLDSFFEVAKAQNWIKLEEVLEIQKGYANIKQTIEKNIEHSFEHKPEVQALENNNAARLRMPDRQEKILTFLKEQGRAQVWQIKEILPEVTKRTLRRDFEALLKQGFIQRIGERNNTFYQIKNA